MSAEAPHLHEIVQPITELARMAVTGIAQAVSNRIVPPAAVEFPNEVHDSLASPVEPVTELPAPIPDIAGRDLLPRE